MANATKKLPGDSKKSIHTTKVTTTEPEDPVERMRYKYCVVPGCKNTTSTSPQKLFFSIPTGPLRTRWCEVMERCAPAHKPLSATSNRFCCEDHFDLERDMENYIQWKVMGTKKTKKLILKKGILPHKFPCREQDDDTTKEQVEKTSEAQSKGEQKLQETQEKPKKRKMMGEGEPQGSQKVTKASPVTEEEMILEQRKKLQKISHVSVTQDTEVTTPEEDVETYTFMIKVEAEDDTELNGGEILLEESIFMDPNTIIQDTDNLLDVKVKVEQLDEEFEPEVIKEDSQKYVIEDETNNTVVTQTHSIKIENLSEDLG
ncbi:jg19068 [Pararge aegeria aegeria]|uniref:Jg19068 protein n=1 Tax=Pararge aegeria aegeria TaxID=348720 RepID=A0A8S4SIJ1_9NEOP|nr:jg19068 [Pararge aegeria aegeria]